MAGKPKRYVLNKDANDNPVSGHCSKCGRIFQFENTTGVRHIEKAFETHECSMITPATLPPGSEEKRFEQ
jgi:hypothetical protein